MRRCVRVLPLALSVLLGGSVSCDEEDSGDETSDVDRGESCYEEADDSLTPPGESKACDCPGGDTAEKICLSSGEFTQCFCEGGW